MKNGPKFISNSSFNTDATASYKKAGFWTDWLEILTLIEWPIKTRDRIPLLLAKIYRIRRGYERNHRLL
jgi:hypothetical protein